MSGSTALVYGATVAWGVLLLVGLSGALFIAGELVYRLHRFHKRGLERVRRAL